MSVCWPKLLYSPPKNFSLPLKVGFQVLTFAWNVKLFLPSQHIRLSIRPLRHSFVMSHQWNKGNAKIVILTAYCVRIMYLEPAHVRWSWGSWTNFLLPFLFAGSPSLMAMVSESVIVFVLLFQRYGRCDMGLGIDRGSLIKSQAFFFTQSRLK